MWLFDLGYFGNMNGTVITGPFANWTMVGTGNPNDLLWRMQGMENSILPTSVHINEVMNMTPFDCSPWNSQSTCFRNYFEGFLPAPRDMHNVVHFYVGGAMRNISISANDPIFYLHHTNVDFLLEIWFVKFGIPILDFPFSGAPTGHNQQECIVPLFPLLSHNYWLGSAQEYGYFYVPPKKEIPSLQYGDEVRDSYLQIINNGLEPFPTGQSPPSIGIVGSGISGLWAAFLLNEAGYNVEILEASTKVGGRMDTHICDFSVPARTGGDVSFLDAGSMRFPCSHWSVFAVARKFNVTLRIFKNNNPDALMLLQCFGNIPVPRRILNPTDSLFDPNLQKQLFSCYNVTLPSEQRSTGELLDNAFALFIDLIFKDSTQWDLVNNILNHYGVASFLREYVGYSSEAVQMIAEVENLSPLLHMNAIEFFRDTAGQWWSDQITYLYPNSSGIYEGLPTNSIWEFSEGASSLPNALYYQLADNIRFGNRVTAIEYGDTYATVTVSVHGETNMLKRTYDYLLLAVPYSILRTFSWNSPLPQEKQKVLDYAYYIPAVKVMVQIHNRTVFTEPSPQVPPQYLAVGIQDNTGGSSQTDTIFGPLYYPTHPSGNRGLAMFYTWGKNAELVSGLTWSDLNKQVLNTLVALHGNGINDEFEFLNIKSWSDSPDEQGAFALYLPEQLNLRDAFTSPVKRLHWIGSDKSDEHGWVHGALLSAIRGVIEIDSTARSLYFPPPNFFQQFDGSVIQVDSHTNITCGHQVQLVTVQFSDNYTYSVDSTDKEIIGTVLQGTVTIEMGSQKTSIHYGQQFLVPPYSHANFKGDIYASLNYAQETDVNGQCHHNSPVVQVQMHAQDEVTLKVRGNLPKVLEGNADHDLLLAVSQANSSRAQFGIGSLTENSETAGPFIVVNDYAFVLPSVDSTSSTYLKIEYSTKFHAYSQVIFPDSDSLITYTIEYSPPQDDIFRPATLEALYNTINDINQQQSSCFVGMGQFGSLSCLVMMTGSYETTPVSYTNRTYVNSTVGLIGCISPTSATTPGKDLVLPSSNSTFASTVFGFLQSANNPNFFFDDIHPQDVEFICSIPDDNIPSKIWLDVYVINEFDDGSTDPSSDSSQSSSTDWKSIAITFITLSSFFCLVLSVATGFVIWACRRNQRDRLLQKREDAD